jgi:hypothetical protein
MTQDWALIALTDFRSKTEFSDLGWAKSKVNRTFYSFLWEDCPMASALLKSTAELISSGS